MRLRVLVVGTSRLVGEAVVAALTPYDVSASLHRAAGSRPDAVDLADTDAVLVGHELPAADLEAWCAHGAELGTPVVLLTDIAHTARVQAGRRLGATAVVTLMDDPQRIAAVLQSPRVAAVPAQREVDLRDGTGALTARELDVLRLIASGRANPDIAEHLNISRHTVRTHMQNILGKLEVPNRFAAVAAARAGGLLADATVGR